VTVVSGAVSLRRCLAALTAQVDAGTTEIIAPYDEWSLDVADLATEFPGVRFHRINTPAGATNGVSTRVHDRYDRRRAVGLALANGAIIALTEDHALPAADWARQVLACHRQAHAVIGGAIENGVDHPMNWALYYADFGRYGRPFAAGPARYVSDVNVAYKRAALEATRDLWIDAYHETSLHWALQARGETLFLDPRMLVSQQRPTPRFAQAYRERIDWGRTFAETRALTCPPWRRLAYAVGTPALPFLLVVRMTRHMRRQRRTCWQLATTLPLAFVLLTGWAIGECAGYLARSRCAKSPPLEKGAGGILGE
jgi:hypothetical protein